MPRAKIHGARLGPEFLNTLLTGEVGDGAAQLVEPTGRALREQIGDRPLVGVGILVDAEGVDRLLEESPEASESGAARVVRERARLVRLVERSINAPIQPAEEGDARVFVGLRPAWARRRQVGFARRRPCEAQAWAAICCRRPQAKQRYPVP